MDASGHANFEWPRFSSLRRRSIKRSVAGAFISAATIAGSTRIQQLDIEQADLEANPETDRKSSKRLRKHDRDDEREAHRRCPPRFPVSSSEPTDIARRSATQAAAITRLGSELERVHQLGANPRPQLRPSFSRIVGMTDRDQPRQRSASRISMELFHLAPICKDITKTGQTCRRPVDAKMGNEDRSTSASRDTVVYAAAHFCYQYTDQDQDHGLTNDASAVRATFTVNAPRFDGRTTIRGSVGPGRVTLNIAVFEGTRTSS